MEDRNRDKTGTSFCLAERLVLPALPRSMLSCSWSPLHTAAGDGQWIRYDLEYVERISWALDLSLILRTIAVLTRKGKGK